MALERSSDDFIALFNTSDIAEVWPYPRVCRALANLHSAVKETGTKLHALRELSCEVKNVENFSVFGGQLGDFLCVLVGIGI